ncbi:receptor-type tyrosine-protein phosphatase C isoform X4 [Paramisgurnus dabryanus]|uniref:receptor-type tyrosine-protein phosphatase C isoform X4 n=1 Tax=Paramisgurnus dabryanus TaxID=90735 RepID=UPI0031F39FB5
MARFFGLGPLILVLCMALCVHFGDSANSTDPSTNPTLTTLNTPAVSTVPPTDTQAGPNGAVTCPKIDIKEDVRALNKTEGRVPGDVIQFDCKSSDKTIDGSSSIICTDTGAWNASVPKCKEISCTPPNIEHETAIQVKDYKKDDTLQYKCVKGYKPRQGTSKCTKDGWTLEPKCEVVKCPKIHTDGDLTASGNTEGGGYGDVIQFDCKSNKRIDGSSSIICMDTGNWSASVPNCIVLPTQSTEKTTDLLTSTTLKSPTSTISIITSPASTSTIITKPSISNIVSTTPTTVSPTSSKSTTMGSGFVSTGSTPANQTTSPTLTPTHQHTNGSSGAITENDKTTPKNVSGLPTLTTSHQPSEEGLSLSRTPSQTSITEKTETNSEKVKTTPVNVSGLPTLTTSPKTPVEVPSPPHIPSLTSKPKETGTNKTTTLPPSTTLKPTTFNNTALPASITIKPPPSETSSSASPTPTTTNSTTTSTSINTGTTLQPGCDIKIMVTNNTAEVTIINGNPNETYTVIIKETSNGNFIHQEIKGQKSPMVPLKPCTKYTAEVRHCKAPEKKTFSTKDTIPPVSTVNDWNDTHVCFKVEVWNFTKCVDINNTAGCSNVSIVENLGACKQKIFVHMPPGKPKINFTEKIPTQFEWSNKPSECNGPLKIHCTREAWNLTFQLNKNVSFLPTKDYTCIGEYTHKHKTTKGEPCPVNIKCDWPKKAVFQNITENGFNISSDSSLMDKCPGIKLQGYSAKCNNTENSINCQQDKENGTVCHFNNLKPYKYYTCDIKAMVTTIASNDTDNVKLSISSGTEQTDSAKPSISQTIHVDYTSHNSIKITCDGVTDWNGKEGTYEAVLAYDGYSDTRSLPVKKCAFSFPDLYYLTTYNIKITATNGEKKSSEITHKTTTKYNDKAVIGFLAFLIIVTSIALLFVLFKIFLLKRKRTPEEIPLTAHSLQNIDPILAENLIEVYKRKIADEGRLFMDEFQSIPRIFSNYTIKEAKKQENQSKNRYVDILPYDYNRVVLTEGSNDYINASFIEGFKEPKKYIAAQGPKDETIEDFWRMIWEQKSSIIVMVTRCEEGNKTKCAQYWPYLERETEIYEDFVVKIKSEEHCPDYIIRHLLVTNKREKAAEREVTHIQFTSWPDHGVPGDPSLLLKLRRRVNSFKNFFSGPIVIHCSAGVGRTGTYIGIDAMIESLESEGRMDIYGYVAKLRRQRCLMVQVESQYILIHTALIEHNQFGETEVLLSDFHSELNTLRHKDGNDTSLLEMEFQKLPKFKNWRTFNTATNEDNKKKNRYSTVVPYDYNRVLFRLELDSNQTSDPEDDDESSSDEEEESNEYINASFIDGYWCGKSLIAAQGPLANTAAEFLLMLYQQQTKTIVMLTDCKEDDKDYCFQYWGDEKKTFGDIEIEVKKTESFTTYVRRRLAIQSTKKKEVLEMDQYQFLKWKSRELPENAQELIEMMRSIRESGGYDNSRKNRSIPIVVHCNNGSSRTGIFCALWNLLDCALTEKLVDVFQAVKNVRKERQGMIETFEQYQFLYTALEGAFPVQNGGIKSQASDSIQIINETTALLSEQASNTNTDQKEEKEEETSKPKESSEQKDTDAPVAPAPPPADAPAADATAKEESSTSPSPPEGDNEKPSTEGTTNGPTVTVEV